MNEENELLQYDFGDEGPLDMNDEDLRDLEAVREFGL